MRPPIAISEAPPIVETGAEPKGETATAWRAPTPFSSPASPAARLAMLVAQHLDGLAVLHGDVRPLRDALLDPSDDVILRLGGGRKN